MAFSSIFTVPVIEIVLFIKVGGTIGLMPTVFIILITAIAGTVFVKQQASQLFDLFKRKAGRLEDPSEPIGHGVLVLFAGALLLTPGFFTDFIGFLYLSQIFDIGCLENLKKIYSRGRFDEGTSYQNKTIYDAEYKDITPNDGSPWKKIQTLKTEIL